jgi:Resolvase, N terminal domain
MTRNRVAHWAARGARDPPARTLRAIPQGWVTLACDLHRAACTYSVTLAEKQPHASHGYLALRPPFPSQFHKNQAAVSTLPATQNCDRPAPTSATHVRPDCLPRLGARAAAHSGQAASASARIPGTMGTASPAPVCRQRRVTTDQDLSIQEAALKAAGCEVIRAEKRSGTTTEGREALRTVLEFLHAGDVLMVTRIDRLARSIGDLQTSSARSERRAPHSRRPSSRSTPARPSASASSTCLGCSPCARLAIWSCAIEIGSRRSMTLKTKDRASAFSIWTRFL